MSNISLLKFLILIRLLFWYFTLLVCASTRTLFIVQTWSKLLTFVIILNLSVSLINLFVEKSRKYNEKFEYFLVIFLSLLIILTFIVYISYLHNIYYYIMNLLTLNIMQNDRNQSLLSISLNYYQCCRMQEEILFDSVNEREYFLAFSYCEKTIEENEMKKDQWDHITTCGTIFRSIIFYTRLFFIFDFLFNLFIVFQYFKHIWTNMNESIENNQHEMIINENFNNKLK
ncbi:hypothetical protein I4U23_019222 [Adineta vaga]|nr:hypothetical protein I4U23_019222 [Adineta vaga]